MKPGKPRRSAILLAAETLLLARGPRATSMEALARAAGVAKPTLYAYFADKDAILDALAEELIAGQRRDLAAALDGEGKLPQRIAAALAVRCRHALRIRAAPHGREVYGADAPGISRPLAELDAELGLSIERVLAAAGVGRPRLMTQLLLAAGAGIGEKALSPSELGPALRLLCERLLRPDLPG